MFEVKEGGVTIVYDELHNSMFINDAIDYGNDQSLRTLTPLNPNGYM